MTQNLEKGGFKVSDREESYSRIHDVVFYFQGKTHSEDRFIVEPQLLNQKTRLFRVPPATKIIEYYDCETTAQDLKSQNMTDEKLRKIVVKNNLIQGHSVLPKSIANPHEACIDRPRLFELFNHFMLGERMEKI
jgi:hypothetical protein